MMISSNKFHMTWSEIVRCVYYLDVLILLNEFIFCLADEHGIEKVTVCVQSLMSRYNHLPNSSWSFDGKVI